MSGILGISGISGISKIGVGVGSGVGILVGVGVAVGARVGVGLGSRVGVGVGLGSGVGGGGGVGAGVLVGGVMAGAVPVLVGAGPAQGLVESERRGGRSAEVPFPDVSRRVARSLEGIADGLITSAPGKWGGNVYRENKSSVYLSPRLLCPKERSQILT